MLDLFLGEKQIYCKGGVLWKRNIMMVLGRSFPLFSAKASLLGYFCVVQNLYNCSNAEKLNMMKFELSLKPTFNARLVHGI